MVFKLMDTMAGTRSLQARESVTKLMSQPPYDGLGLTTDQMLGVWRVVVLVAGALAAACLVFAVYLLRRHQGARIGFTVAAAALALSIPAVGVLPVILLAAAAGLWSEPARDWFAGREPRAVLVGDRAGDRVNDGTDSAPTGWLRSEQLPEQPPAQPPTAQPPPTQPPTVEPPSGQPGPSPYPYGSPPPATTAPAAYPQQPPGQPPYPQPPLGQQAYGQPVHGPDQPYAQSYGQPYPQPGQPPQYYYPQTPPSPAGRPGTVTWAAILTWIGAGLVLLTGLAVLAAMVAAHDSFLDEIDRQLRTNADFKDLNMSARDIASAVSVVFGIIVLWCIATIVFAVFMFRGHNWARIVLAVSAAAAALLSLIAVLSLVSVLPLAAAVTAGILMFTPSANAFFRGSGGAPGASPPPQQPYASGGPW